MTEAWYPGIKAFCSHWDHAPMLRQTFATLEAEFFAENDACVDAAKAMVECCCRVLIEELDDPSAPLKPDGTDVKLAVLLGVATRLLDLGDIRDRAFSDLIRSYNKLGDSLRVLRNKSGTVSHGKDGFIQKLSLHQRRAAVLAADAIVTFLHEAYLEREPDPVRTMEPYERFAESSDLINRLCFVGSTETNEYGLQIDIRLPNGDDIPLAITPAEILFSIDRDAYKAALNACRDAEKEEVVEDTGDLDDEELV
ncbi:abortive infection family protein [Rhodospira trueperi]|uniref:Abortive infection C-terminus n=1 Tax=Rhodospira trueperi TaxID=69960 RepID=A0A1G7HGN2_9PROT|nr:abortive infection family protein [Rhodospira trueperi]SDE99463.1 Abortive infection C-terminus [Rhodospira trueperi]